MGLFSFFKGGVDVDDIQEMLKRELGEKISNLKTEFHEQYNLVGLSGECDSMATREKAILLAGNVKGVEKVNARFLKAPEDAEPRETAPEAEGSESFDATTPEQLLEQPSEPPKMESEFYEIKSGDTLSKIAKEFYGNAGKYPVIFEANREVIKDPDRIYPGQMIRIPKL